MAAEGEDSVAEWLRALERRQLRDLTFVEVRRALQALSSLYVERRQRIGSGAALDGRGKRAAFALYYGPLHFLAVREVVRGLDAARPAPTRIVDLGCGTGVGGAAWALEAQRRPRVEAVDQNGWAVAEARWTLERLGLRGNVRRGSIARAPLPRRGEAALAAYALNELAGDEREARLQPLLEAARAGARVLVVEPIARRAVPWWGRWREAFLAAGGRDDDWRFRVALPEAVARLDRAAGLDHRELTARSLYLGGGARGQS